jgi:adhesin HecA-like repeat protein
VENVLRLTTGAQAPAPVFYKGENFSAAALAGLLSKRGRLMNREHAMSGLVASGDLRVTDVGRIDNARSVLQSEAIHRAFSQKRDLDGVLPVVFYLYDSEGRRVAPGPTKKLGKPTTVFLHGLPGDTLSKRKHIWIYSKDGNRGLCRPKLFTVS